MFHIKDDQRSRTSAERIYQGLSACLKVKSLERVTVTDVQAASSVGRATFYRCFDCTSDVLHWRCDQAFGEMAARFLESPRYHQRPEGLLLCFFEYWGDHSEILEQLLAANRMDLIHTCHRENSHGISEFFREKFPLPEQDYEYHMALRSGMFTGMLMVWLERGKRETPAQLLAILTEQWEFLRKTPVFL